MSLAYDFHRLPLCSNAPGCTTDPWGIPEHGYECARSRAWAEQMEWWQR